MSIIRKNHSEIEMMISVGHKLGQVFDRLAQEIRPGRTTAEIDHLAEKFLAEVGCKPTFKGYDGFPGAICASVNEVLIHGIPSKEIVLKEGDILSIDMGNVDSTGFQGDACRTFAVGNISVEAQKLIRCTEECFYEALKVCHPGRHLYEISMAIQRVADRYGFSLCEDYGGHGIGKEMHEDPFIYNYYDMSMGKGPILKPGYCLAIEPMVMSKGSKTRLLKDNWGVVSADSSLTCHYENDVIITENGPVITSVDSNVKRHLNELENIIVE